jgi:YHS domain-containing protein
MIWAKKDKDGDLIYWGKCVGCGERTHHKVKDATHREMIPGETYYYMHQECADRFARYRETK